MGFPENQIKRTSQTSNGSIERSFARGRVDFIISYEEDLKANLSAIDESDDNIVIAMKIKEYNVYLAGVKKSLQPMYFEKLK